MNNFLRLSVLMVLLAGCASIIKQTTVEDTEWGKKRTETVLRAPKYSLGDSVLSTSNGITTAVLSASQDAKGIESVKAEGRGILLMYAICGALMLYGVFTFAFLNDRRDGAIVAGIGAIMFLVVKWGNASASIMAIVVPVVAVFAVGFAAFMWWRKRKRIPVTTDSAQ